MAGWMDRWMNGYVCAVPFLEMHACSVASTSSPAETLEHYKVGRLLSRVGFKRDFLEVIYKQHVPICPTQIHFHILDIPQNAIANELGLYIMSSYVCCTTRLETYIGFTTRATGFPSWRVPAHSGLTGLQGFNLTPRKCVLHEAKITTQRLQCSSFWFMTCFLLRGYIKLSEKELHSSLWVGAKTHNAADREDAGTRHVLAAEVNLVASYAD